MKKIILGIIITIIGILILFKDNTKLIGVYLDNEYSTNIPDKNSDYVIDKIECDTDAKAIWDNSLWTINISSMNKKTKCNLYFRKDKITKDIINSLDTTGKCPTINSNGTVNITTAESVNSLVCSAPDNYGTSYYFRGNVVNNYVYFGGYYWRIIRINGDNTIRIIYDGTKPHQNNEASDDKIIGKSAFNDSYNDNAYVGYMYGQIGATNYNDTHTNLNDSTIKKYLDTWYQQNLKDYETYIGDSIFCNDRQTSYSGYGTIASHYRWVGAYGNPTLKCSLYNDSFTVNKNTIGNGSLSYGISLITADEAELAGIYYNVENLNSYLYTGSYYATISPIGFNDVSSDNNYRALTSYIRDNSMINWADSIVKYGVAYQYGVKPVINLKAGSLKSGNGSSSSPYLVG